MSGISLKEKERRWSLLRKALQKAGLSALIVYGGTQLGVPVHYLTRVWGSKQNMVIFPVDSEPGFLIPSNTGMTGEQLAGRAAGYRRRISVLRRISPWTPLKSLPPSASRKRRSASIASASGPSLNTRPFPGYARKCSSWKLTVFSAKYAVPRAARSLPSWRMPSASPTSLTIPSSPISSQASPRSRSPPKPTKSLIPMTLSTGLF